MLSKDEIIATIAKEQQVLISRDDPILAFLVVHQIILDEYAKSIGQDFEGNTQQFIETLQETQNEFAKQSKELANDLVGKSVNKISEAEQSLTEMLKSYDLKQQQHKEELNKIYALQITTTAIILIMLAACIFVGVFF